MKTKLPPNTQAYKPLLNEFKDNLKQLYGQRLVSLILFGSFARGTMHEESDIDMLVVLRDMDSPYKEIDYMGDIKNDFLIENDLVISTIPTTLSRFNANAEPLYKIIKDEGIAL